METMPYTLFYSKDINQGKINYQNETVAISIETYLYGSGIWTVSIERALQAVYDGLNATKRKDDWGLDRWPQRGVTELNAFERRGKNFSVAFELVNSRNKVIGRQTLQSGGSWGLNWSGRPSIEMSNADRKTLNFQSVNANDITDNLTIRVASVNGTDAETAAIDGVLRIRAIAKNDANLYDSFKFSRGEVQGFANRHAENTKDLVIPDAIWGDQVISIGKEAFKNASLTNVVIPNSVNYIGEEAFSKHSTDYRDEYLRSITIGANVAMAKNSFRHSWSGQNLIEGVEGSFQDGYNKNGKKAGTYSYGRNSRSMTAGSEWSDVERQEAKKEQELERDKRLIRLGARWRGGWFGQSNPAGSELFGKSYANYEEMGNAEDFLWGIGGHSWYLTPGLTLGFRITGMITIATELNYNLVNYYFWYGDNKHQIDRTGEENFANVSIFYQTIEVPVLLRLEYSRNDVPGGFYAEAGFQLGFPVSSKATVSSGSWFPDSPFKDEYSDFRVEKDYGLVFGGGIRLVDFSMGLRFTFPSTKLDKYGTINAPSIYSFTFAYDFF
jgi:hypothetical protein